VSQNQAALDASRDSLLRRRDVEKRVGLGRSAIYARMARGSFPKPVHDTETETVWWLESEVDTWVRERVEASRKQAA